MADATNVGPPLRRLSTIGLLLSEMLAVIINDYIGDLIFKMMLSKR